MLTLIASVCVWLILKVEAREMETIERDIERNRERETERARESERERVRRVQRERVSERVNE
jgi:hypothetical protein